MRHYGAPTRLLDFTYSKYVATYFALECAFDSKERSSSIWCIKLDELLGAVQKKYPEVELLNKKRSKDSERNDRTFKDLFMRGRDIALWENPVQMHKRLHLQQGVALCPGNIERTFMQNLLDPYENVGKWQIIKITCKFEPSELTKAFQQFMRMNLTRESLFPELDGLAQSMKYQFWFYKELAKHNPEIYKEFIK